jgi:hypothetical protein
MDPLRVHVVGIEPLISGDFLAQCTEFSRLWDDYVPNPGIRLGPLPAETREGLSGQVLPGKQMALGVAPVSASELPSGFFPPKRLKAMSARSGVGCDSSRAAED